MATPDNLRYSQDYIRVLAAGNSATIGLTEFAQKRMGDPAILNEDSYGEGWLLKVKMSAPNDVKKLMTAKEYDEFCKEE